MVPSGSSGKCAVITGASRGIGFAAAQRFLSAGYRVINLSRSPVDLAGMTNIQADLSAPDWARTAEQPLLDAVGDAETLALVHNSAFNIPAPVQAVQAADFRHAFEVGVIAPSVLNQLLLERMRPGSSIIYIGSTLSQRSTKGMAAYTSVKHALLGLMRATCQDLAGKGVHTCCVCPGFTDTEMLRAYGGEALTHLAGLSTQNRLIAPTEIAEVIFFGAANPVVNGAALNADLGFIEP
ncbi:MAG: SDR family NAD(P)-dependent oxidoreductase [Caulobacteraceae bacterium]|nr:SDR family NAD(P)-dependent oxidoreductase [Caulobacteraceae bacterium]